MHAIPLQLKYSSGALTTKIFRADCPAPGAVCPCSGTKRGPGTGSGPAVTPPAGQPRAWFRAAVIINHGVVTNRQ